MDETEVVYQTDEFYSPQNERGLRWDDPALQLNWPIPITNVSPRDERWALLSAK
jgi:dTDP-4-dehydrorhamnose 3,5-epimerase